MRNPLQLVRTSLLIGITIVLCVGFSVRTSEKTSSYRTPDGTHFHQVFANFPLTEEFTATARGLSGIGIFAQAEDPEALAHITVRDISTNQVISEQGVQVQNVHRISLPRQSMSVGKRYSITISAPDTPKSQSIKIAYQSDATKDPTSIVTQAGVQKQGSLGLIEYERPTVALVFARWLALPHQRALWLGILVCSIGIVIRKNIPSPKNTIHTTHVQKNLTACLVIILATLTMYWPATRLFFYSDDVPILARVAMLLPKQPLLLLTPHRYTDADPQSQFGFDFYRPVSFSLYPLFLHVLVPTNAGLYYFLNIILFTGVACFLYIIARRLTRSAPASLLLVFLWISHSSKLGLVYWWSSVQDLLASFFAMLAMVLYFRWKDSNNATLLRLSIISFCIGLFSKEYVIAAPVIIGCIELMQSSISKQNAIRITRTLSPYIVAMGAFLIINTAVLGDPTLPARKHTDQTYALSSNPITIIRNVVVYSSFTAEQRLWPQTSSTLIFEQKLSDTLELWRLKTAGPYYPGVAILTIAALLVILFWKRKEARNNLLLGYVWWVLFIAPFLLFTSDWRPRWLTLATFGSSLAIVTVFQQALPKKSKTIWYVLLCAVFVYGYTTARDENLTRFFREQSAYTQEAYIQLITQEAHIQDEKRIILVGITPDQQTSLNAYLFRLYAKNPMADIIYADALPQSPAPGDVIINMMGIVPYYPESEK